MYIPPFLLSHPPFSTFALLQKTRLLHLVPTLGPILANNPNPSPAPSKPKRRDRRPLVVPLGIIPLDRTQMNRLMTTKPAHDVDIPVSDGNAVSTPRNAHGPNLGPRLRRRIVALARAQPLAFRIETARRVQLPAKGGDGETIARVNHRRRHQPLFRFDVELLNGVEKVKAVVAAADVDDVADHRRRGASQTQLHLG